MKDMKIEINADQSLDDVVRELERFWLKPTMQAYWEKEYKWIGSTNGTYCLFESDMWYNWHLTTLKQLREMK